MIACRLADDRLSSARRQVIVSGVIGYHQRDNRRVLPIRSAVVYPKKFGPMPPTVQPETMPPTAPAMNGQIALATAFASAYQSFFSFMSFSFRNCKTPNMSHAKFAKCAKFRLLGCFANLAYFA